MKFLLLVVFIVTLKTKHIDSICWPYSECCYSDYYVKNDFAMLERNLTKNLFGQPFVKKVLVGALRAHLNRNNRPDRPLVISLHGDTGTGKNLVYRMVANSLFHYGTKSDFVLAYSANQFLHKSEVAQYKEKIKGEIEAKMSTCEYSLFVFDEMDKMPVAVMDVIKPFLDPLTQRDAEKYRRSTFIFLSNSGSKAINFKNVEMFKQNIARDNLQMSEFRKVIENMVYTNNKEGANGFWHLALVKNHLIDHYIPFLPLERVHVKECIVAEFAGKSVDQQNPITNKFSEDIDYVLAQLSFESDGGMYVFSDSGCKRVRKEVDLYINEHKPWLLANNKIEL